MIFLSIQNGLKRTFLLFFSPAQTADIVNNEEVMKSVLFWIISGFVVFGIFISITCGSLYFVEFPFYSNQALFFFNLFFIYHLRGLLFSAVFSVLIYGLIRMSGTNLNFREAVKVSCIFYPAHVIPVYAGGSIAFIIVFLEQWLSPEAVGVFLCCVLYGVIWSVFIASYILRDHSGRSMLFSAGVVILSVLIVCVLNTALILSGLLIWPVS